MFKRHPVDNPRITYGFGAGSDKWGAVGHLGVDYGDDEGTPIYAPADGFVVWARGSAAAAGNPWEQMPNSGNNGNCIILNHGPEDWATHTLYAHLSRIVVKEGQWVRAGDLIGYMGNTGYSFGSHLHWEMFIDYSEGQYPDGTFYGRVDPLDYFDVVTTVPVAPGPSGGTSTTKTPAPTPQPKEWYEMPIPKADLDAIARAVHHAQLPLGAKDTLSNEWWLSKVIPEGIDSLAKTMASQNAQVRNLVSAVAALAKGESFDEAKLLAGVQAAAAAGVKEAIDSIDTTVNLKEQP